MYVSRTHFTIKKRGLQPKAAEKEPQDWIPAILNTNESLSSFR